MSFEKDLKIQAEYSKPCYEFFGNKIKDQSILDLAFKGQEEDLKDIFDMSFEDSKKIDIIRPLLPKEILINGKSLKANYFFIPASRNSHLDLSSEGFTHDILKIMMVFTDITKEKSLHASILEEEENKDFILYVSVNRAVFIDTFLEIKKIKENIIKESEKEKKDQGSIERGFHTLKGIYAQTKMKKVSHKIHSLESELKRKFKKKKNGSSNDFSHFIDQSLAEIKRLQDFYLSKVTKIISEDELEGKINFLKINLNRLNDLLEPMKKLTDEKAHKEIQIFTDKIKWRETSEVFNVYKEAILEISNNLEKKLKLKPMGKALSSFRKTKVLFLILLSMPVRNSVDHGIEKPEKESHVGKA